MKSCYSGFVQRPDWDQRELLLALFMPKPDLDLEMVFLGKHHLRSTDKKHSPEQDAGASLFSLSSFFKKNNRGGSKGHTFCKNLAG